MVKTEIIELIQQIRLRVTDFPRQHRLGQNEAHWSRLVSAMDTIEDAEEAIDYFLKHLKFDGSPWGFYILALYGFMQSLEIEQDATEALFASLKSESQLGFNLHDHKALREVRNIRNEVVGHPTNRRIKNIDGPDSEFYYQLLRESKSTSEFKYGELDMDGKRNWRTIKTEPLYHEQARILADQMRQLIEQLDKTEGDYKAKFMNIKLADFLKEEPYPGIPQFMMAACNPAKDHERRQGIQVITWMKEKINSLEQQLLKRELPLDGFDAYRKEIFHACDKLMEMFDYQNCENVNPLDSKIYGVFVKLKYKEFQEWAAELDRYYSS